MYVYIICRYLYIYIYLLKTLKIILRSNIFQRLTKNKKIHVHTYIIHTYIRTYIGTYIYIPMCIYANIYTYIYAYILCTYSLINTQIIIAVVNQIFENPR